MVGIMAESELWGMKFKTLEQLDEGYKNKAMQWPAGNGVWGSSKEERECQER